MDALYQSNFRGVVRDLAEGGPLDQAALDRATDLRRGIPVAAKIPKVALVLLTGVVCAAAARKRRRVPLVLAGVTYGASYAPFAPSPRLIAFSKYAITLADHLAEREDTVQAHLNALLRGEDKRADLGFGLGLSTPFAQERACFADLMNIPEADLESIGAFLHDRDSQIPADLFPRLARVCKLDEGLMRLKQLELERIQVPTPFGPLAQLVDSIGRNEPLPKAPSSIHTWIDQINRRGHHLQTRPNALPDALAFLAPRINQEVPTARLLHALESMGCGAFRLEDPDFQARVDRFAEGLNPVVAGVYQRDDDFIMLADGVNATRLGIKWAQQQDEAPESGKPRIGRIIGGGVACTLEGVAGSLLHTQVDCTDKLIEHYRRFIEAGQVPAEEPLACTNGDLVFVGEFEELDPQRVARLFKRYAPTDAIYRRLLNETGFENCQAVTRFFWDLGQALQARQRPEEGNLQRFYDRVVAEIDAAKEWIEKRYIVPARWNPQPDLTQRAPLVLRDSHEICYPPEACSQRLAASYLRANRFLLIPRKLEEAIRQLTEVPHDIEAYEALGIYSQADRDKVAARFSGC